MEAVNKRSPNAAGRAPRANGSSLDALATAGHVITEYHRLGDHAINNANNTARHNGALLAAFHAVNAVTPPSGPPVRVLRCDRGDGSAASKEDAARRWAHLNDGHIPDIARITVPPQLLEVKVWTPYNQRVATGRGHTPNGGAPSTSEGHLIAFGNTEENQTRIVLGLRQIGDEDDGKYDRDSGTGYVAAFDGQYRDALAKGHGTTLCLAETTGALSPPFMATLRQCGRLSRRPGAVDLTQYGEGRASPKDFLTHHVAAISTSIQLADANTILNDAANAVTSISLGLM